MNVIAWITLAAALSGIWLALNHVIFRDIFSPFALLLPTWILPALLTLTKLSDKVHPWQLETVLMVVTMTMIMVGNSLGASLLLSRRGGHWNQAGYADLIKHLNSRSFTILLVGCHLLGIAGLVYNELVTNPVGIPLLTYMREPDISRDPNWLWKGGSMWFLSLPAFALGPFLYLKFRTAHGFVRKCFYLALSVAYPFVELIKMSRSEVIYALTALGMAEYYYRKHTLQPRGVAVKLWQRVAIVSLLVALAIGSGSVFSKIRATRSFSEMGEMMGIAVDLPEPYASTVMEFYVYFALPFENFNNLANNYPWRLNLGVGGLRPFFSLTGNGHVVRDQLAAINMDGYLRMLPANTYPVLAYLYLEAGWFSIITFPFIFSFVINFFYVIFRKQPTTSSMIAYMLSTSFLWMWMFSNNNFTGIQFYMVLAIGVGLPLLHRCLQRNRHHRDAMVGQSLQINHVIT